LKIVSAELVACSAEPALFPKETLPEIAFLGRSNVGKSSLINSLLGGRRLAFTSATPGKTQQIIFFRVNQRFFFVDLPGYGYAKVARSLRDSWKQLIESYLRGRKELKVSILIVDSRIGPTHQDLQKLAWLQGYSLPFFIVSTKADKLSRVELQKSLKHTQSMCRKTPVVAYSAVQGTGYDEVWAMLQPYVSMRSSHS
jgi:GTP-binding protein